MNKSFFLKKKKGKEEILGTDREKSHADPDKTQVLPPVSSVICGELLNLTVSSSGKEVITVLSS